MERLTYWNKSNENYAINSTRENGVTAYKAVQKLGELEDLEEQLGMSLEDFYACVTHNEESFFIIEMNDDSEEFEIIEVFKEDGYMHNYSCGKFMFCGHACGTNENYYESTFAFYGQDMFLTREEAEKKLEELKCKKE